MIFFSLMAAHYALFLRRRIVQANNCYRTRKIARFHCCDDGLMLLLIFHFLPLPPLIFHRRYYALLPYAIISPCRYDVSLLAPLCYAIVTHVGIIAAFYATMIRHCRFYAAAIICCHARYLFSLIYRYIIMSATSMLTPYLQRYAICLR